MNCLLVQTLLLDQMLLLHIYLDFVPIPPLMMVIFKWVSHGIDMELALHPAHSKTTHHVICIVDCSHICLRVVCVVATTWPKAQLP